MHNLTQVGRYIIIIAAFLGWFFGGMHLGITSLSMGSAAKDLLRGSGQFEVTVADRLAAEQQFEESVKSDVVRLAQAQHCGVGCMGAMATAMATAWER